MQRFPITYQHDAMQCGIACLQIICWHYGRTYNVETISQYCHATTEGVSINSISMDMQNSSNSGGTDTIKVQNHHYMWLISDAEVHFNDSTYWVSPIQNEVSPHQFEMDGKWFKIVIPHDNTSLIVATITENALASSDRWYIKVNISAGGESDKYILVKSKEHDK